MALLINAAFAVLVVGTLAGLIGGFIALAARGRAKRDRILVQAENALPGLNCGVCGFPTCSAYANALRRNAARIDLCVPGGEKLSKNLAKIMGLEVSYREEKSVVQVHCRGRKANSVYRFDYRGLEDCTALFLQFGGDKECKFSCLGQGSCIKVCPAGAVHFDDEGCVWVDRNLCTDCGKCLEVCPTGVMRPVPKTADYIVACNSTDKAEAVSSYCKVGCTGCRACERRAPEGGFDVDNHLARINYRRRGERWPAESACPTHCIILNGREDRVMEKDQAKTEKNA